MNCDGVQELLSVYVDGELSSGELLRVEQHLRRCPVCAEEVDALRQTVAFVGALEEVELPAGFREGLRARLAEVKPQLQPVRPVAPLRPAWHRQVARWALPAAAAAALALVSTGAYGRLGTTLFGNVADHTPTKEVVTPSVPNTNNPGNTTPPPVAVDIDPKPPVTDVVTDPNPKSETHTDPGIGEQPVVVPPNPGEANPETHPGKANTEGGPAVATLIDQVQAPSKLPAQVSYTTKMQAMVPDLTAACSLIKNTYPEAVCTTKDAGRRIEVNFSVAVDQADGAQAQVTAQIRGGITATTESVDHAAQLQAAFERVATLSEDLTKLEQQVATAKDAEQKKADETLLAQKRDEGEHAVADYNRLKAEINSHLFVIDLEKQGQ